MKNFISILIFVSLFCTPAMADHYNFVTLQFPPLEYAQKGDVSGIAVDLVRIVMKNLGHTVDIKLYPWARSLDMVKKGTADAIFTAYKNPERETFLDYSKTVLIPQIVSLYVQKNSTIVYDGDLLKLKNYPIGIVNTISYGTTFDSVKNDLKLQRTETLESNFQKLKIGRVQIVISNMYVADSVLKTIGYQDMFKKLSPAVQTVDSFIAFSKVRGLSDLRDKFDAEFEKIIADGTYAKVMADYGITK